MNKTDAVDLLQTQRAIDAANLAFQKKLGLAHFSNRFHRVARRGGFALCFLFTMQSVVTIAKEM